MTLGPVAEALGGICKALLPLPEEVHEGAPASPLAVCTLSSMDLLRELAASGLMGRVALAGRLLSENRGIDALLRSLCSPGPPARRITALLLCGREVRGHLAGDALLRLHAGGVDPYGRIVGSPSPDPVLRAGRGEVERFRKGVRIINRIGVADLGALAGTIMSASGAGGAPRAP